MDGEKVDEVLLALGRWGRWQVLQGIWLSITYIPLAFQYTNIVFIGYEPEFGCEVNRSDNAALTNMTKQLHARQCEYTDYHGNTSISCGGRYEFYEPSFISIVAEWNLVCDSSYLVQLSQTFLSLGLAIGNCFISLSDRFGRKRTLVVCHWIMLLVAAATAMSPNIIFFICARFILGLVFPAVNVIMCVMLVELFAAEQRASIAMLSKFVWAGGIMALTFVAYLFQTTSWRYFQLFITAFSLLVIVHTFLLEESVRWLLAVNRKKDAMEILKRAAKFNKISFKDKLAPIVKDLEFGSISVFHSLQDLVMVDRTKFRSNLSLPLATAAASSEFSRQNGQMSNDDYKPEVYQIKVKEKSTELDEKQEMLLPGVQGDEFQPDVYQIKGKSNELDGKQEMLLQGGGNESAKFTDLFRHPTLRKNVLISSYIIFVDVILYYGLLLMSSSLAGDRFINVMLSGAVEIPAYAACIYVLSRFGRKPCMLGFHILSSGMLALAIVVNVTKEARELVSVVV